MGEEQQRAGSGERAESREQQPPPIESETLMSTPLSDNGNGWHVMSKSWKPPIFSQVCQSVCVVNIASTVFLCIFKGEGHGMSVVEDLKSNSCRTADNNICNLHLMPPFWISISFLFSLFFSESHGQVELALL